MSSMAFTAAEMAEHRADAEAMMTSRFRAYAPTGRMVQNEENGREEAVFDDKGETIGKLPGVSRVSLDPRIFDQNVAGGLIPKLSTGLHIPLSAYVVAGRLLVDEGWEFVCTAIADHTDPAALGLRWRVDGVPKKDYATARRLEVTEVQA